MNYRDAAWKVKGELMDYPVARVAAVTAQGRYIDPGVADALKVGENVTAQHLSAWWRLDSVQTAVREFLLRDFTVPHLDELPDNGRPVGVEVYGVAQLELARAVAPFAAALAALAPADRRERREGAEWRKARLEGWTWPAEVVDLAETLREARDTFAAVAVRYHLGVEDVAA